MNEAIPVQVTVKTVPESVYEGRTEKDSPYSGRLPAEKMCTSSAAVLQVNLLSSKVIDNISLSQFFETPLPCT